MADDGDGIAASALPQLFDKLYRGDRSDSSRAGAGLGLSIYKGLVEAKGGEIKVESPVESLSASREAQFALSFRIRAQPKAIPDIES